jgi:hypothetical protein
MVVTTPAMMLEKRIAGRPVGRGGGLQTKDAATVAAAVGAVAAAMAAAVAEYCWGHLVVILKIFC